MISVSISTYCSKVFLTFNQTSTVTSINVIILPLPQNIDKCKHICKWLCS